ncbi:hypothetical protein ACHAXM_006069 [Skeletonema potamos]
MVSQLSGQGLLCCECDCSSAPSQQSHIPSLIREGGMCSEGCCGHTNNFSTTFSSPDEDDGGIPAHIPSIDPAHAPVSTSSNPSNGQSQYPSLILSGEIVWSAFDLVQPERHRRGVGDDDSSDALTKRAAAAL